MKLATLPVLLLAACTSVVPSTVARLSALSPLDADPAGVEVALSLPAGIDILPGSAVLILSADQSGTANEERFVLERAEALNIGGALMAQQGGRIALYRIAPADVPRLRAQQALIRDWKARDPAMKGGLGLSLGPCLRGPAPAEDAMGEVWLRTEKNGDFLPLVRPTPLARLYGAGTIESFPPCG